MIRTNDGFVVCKILNYNMDFLLIHSCEYLLLTFYDLFQIGGNTWAKLCSQKIGCYAVL